ncbi:MAG: exosortase-associated EpsI family protein [Phycisphaerales bacterium]
MSDASTSTSTVASTSTSASDTSWPFDARSRTALIALAVVMLLATAGFRGAAMALNVYLDKEPVELRSHFDTISTRLGEWQSAGPQQKLEKEMLEELGTDLYLDRVYTIGDSGKDRPWVSLHLAYYTGIIDAVPHVPDRCMVAAGFNKFNEPDNLPLAVNVDDFATETEIENLVTGERYRSVDRRDRITGRTTPVLMPIGDLKLRTTRFVAEDTANADSGIFAGYFFIANGRIAVTPGEVKALAFKPQEKYAYYCKVQFYAVRDGLTEEQFLDEVSSLLKPLLPELMRCLPDWSEVERGEISGLADSME